MELEQLRLILSEDELRAGMLCECDPCGICRGRHRFIILSVGDYSPCMSCVGNSRDCEIGPKPHPDVVRSASTCLAWPIKMRIIYEVVTGNDTSSEHEEGHRLYHQGDMAKAIERIIRNRTL